MTKSKKTTGVFGIDANNKSIRKDPPKKRKPKFAHGAELKNKVLRKNPPKRKPKFQAGAELKKAVE